LQTVGIRDFFTNLDACKVHCEYAGIDIYITDGDKHIIIENKIWAGDQKKQIKGYIEAINDENEGLNEADLMVMYLSVNRKKPSNYSLFNDEKICKNGFEVEGKNLVGRGKHEGKKYQFFNLNYHNQIEKWLEKSHQQIENITNLSVGIAQYQAVIQKIIWKVQGESCGFKYVFRRQRQRKSGCIN
jgi:hypothetical protein